MTSHDVVSKLRRILNQRRIGHTGTLDKSATGLLVVCLGKATKAAQFISDADKRYEAEITFGRISKTYDTEGVDFSQPENEIPELDKIKIDEYLESFRGKITQTVPPFSAVHVDGQRLYKLAVKGVDVELPKRNITIHDIKINSYQADTLNITVHSSKGTYIRSLAHDLGQDIGCGAYLSDLRRIAIGNILLENALTFEDVETLHEQEKLEENLLSYNQVIDYASCSIADDYINSIYQGRDIYIDFIKSVQSRFKAGDRVSVTDSNGNILAVCKAEIESDLIADNVDKKLFSYIRVLH